MTRFAAFFALAFALAGVRAAPTLDARKALDVFDPPILYPNAATVWFAGQSHNVTWDTSGLPSTLPNGSMIQLRIARSSTIFVPVTLASNFSLVDGREPITLPENLMPRDDYEIVLFGDSGNVSPAFTIL
ncbi:hypothetical protein K439DRAFT_1627051, partial [Ramaria rubella]